MCQNQWISAWRWWTFISQLVWCEQTQGIRVNWYGSSTYCWISGNLQPTSDMSQATWNRCPKSGTRRLRQMLLDTQLPSNPLWPSGQWWKSPWQPQRLRALSQKWIHKKRLFWLVTNDGQMMNQIRLGTNEDKSIKGKPHFQATSIWMWKCIANHPPNRRNIPACSDLFPTVKVRASHFSSQVTPMFKQGLPVRKAKAIKGGPEATIPGGKDWKGTGAPMVPMGPCTLPRNPLSWANSA